MSNLPLEHRLHIAYFSPLPPNRSGIANSSWELLPYLAKFTDITLFTSKPNQIEPSLHSQFPVRPIEKYPRERWDFDIALYQMGNSIHHESMYRILTGYPGIVVLHDFFLHHFFIRLTIKRNMFPLYSREMGYALGLDGINRAWTAKLGYQPYDPFEFPLNNRTLDLSLGVIVRSHYAQQLIQQQWPDLPITMIPHLIDIRPKEQLHQELDIPKNTIIFASVGHIRPDKQIDVTLRVFARLRKELPNVYYLIIGEETTEIGLTSIIRELKLEDSVKRIGFVDDFQTFVNWIGTADIIVNLRYPTVGETSGTALRALAAGCPVIVSDHGWYGELPDNVCLKIPPLDEEALFEAMFDLASRPEQRRKMGISAAQYIKRSNNPQKIARDHILFITKIVANLR